MELLMALIVASLGSTQGGFCKNIDITPEEAAVYAHIIGIKKEWSGGEQPYWYTSLLKNTADKVSSLSSKVEDGNICSYLEDINKIISRQDFDHLLQNILILSFNDCNGISAIQLGSIDAGDYNITSGKREDAEKFVLIYNTSEKMKNKYGKDYCTLIEYTYDSIYKNQYNQRNDAPSILINEHKKYEETNVKNNQKMDVKNSNWNDAFLGLKIGGKSSSIFALENEVLARNSDGSIKLVQIKVDKNKTLSATYDSVQDRIIYIELNWKLTTNSKEERYIDRKTGIRNFEFGKTSLNEIRKELKSNGFTFKKNDIKSTKNGIITFNAYEIKDTPAIYVVFVTLLKNQEIERITNSSKEQKTNNPFGSHAKIDSIILADETYLDLIWGKEKIYDLKSKPISLN